MTKIDALQRNLGGENLLWSQSPRSIASFRGSNIFVFTWGVVWTLFAAWITSQLSKNGNSEPSVVRCGFVGFGVLFTLLSLSDVFRAVFSIYAITDKRLIIVRKYPWSVEVESFYTQDIEFVKKVQKNDGSGNVIFKTIKVRSGKGYRDTDIGFFGVDDVDSVEKIISQNFRNNSK